MSKKKTHRKPAVQPGRKAQAAPTGKYGSKKTGPASRRSDRKRKRSASTSPWLWIALAAAVILAISAAVIYLNGRNAAEPTITQISASQAYQKYQEGAYFLDVRSLAEWEELHIPNSTVIPLDELADRLGELPQDREIVVVCLVGMRSQEGQQLLVQSGFEDAFCLEDGIQAWQSAGYPTESSR